MTSVRENIIETAALGRPFQLGMLYDCRNDAIVPGMTLWDREQLQQNKDVHPQNNTEFTVTTKDTIDEKAKHLKVDGELKLSLLGNLVTVNGAARYFSDTKRSFIQERLTLQYRTSTRFEQLTMNHLAQGKMDHHEVFDHDVATHVVTAVLYGADAYFVFDREENLSEDTTNVEVEGKIAFDKLKILLSAGSHARVNLKENEKAVTKQLRCTFYGDFKLPSNPATFEEAMKVYTDLPKMLGEKGEHAVPVRVWLYPLIKLDSKAAKLERDISTDIIRSVESVIEALNVTNMKCGDLLQDTVAKSFSTFYDKVQEFQKFCYEYKKDFMKKLGSLLPDIRGGKNDMSAISDLLQAHEKSPFNTRDLQKWITMREKKSKQIKTLLKQLFDLGAVVDDIDKYLLDLKVKKLVVYAFNCIQHEDLLLTKQKIYLNNSTMKNNSENTTDLNFHEKSWTSDELMKMKNNLNFFMDLITFNNKTESTKFIVQSLPQTSNNAGSCILVYENGGSEAFSFSPPSKPECPKIESVTENSVTVKLSPSCSDTLQRKLLYKIKEEKDWISHLVDQDVVTLTDLKAGTDYEIKCGVVGKLNYSVESDINTVTTTIPVVKPQKIQKSTEIESTKHVSGLFSRLFENPQYHNRMLLTYRKFLVCVSGKSLNADKKFIDQLKRSINLQQVYTVDECDFILVFCPVVSRAGTDTEAAMKKLQSIADTKPAVLVVFHHTFDPQFIVPDTWRTITRKNTIAVDCLFHEDMGILQCDKNNKSLSKTTTFINSLEKPRYNNVKQQEQGGREPKNTNTKVENMTNQEQESGDAQHQQMNKNYTKRSYTDVENMKKKLARRKKILKDLLEDTDVEEEQLNYLEETLAERDAELMETNVKLHKANEEKERLERKVKQLEIDLQEHLKKYQMYVEINEKNFAEKDKELKETNSKLQKSTEQLNEKSRELDKKHKLIEEKESQLENTNKKLKASENKLETLKQELEDIKTHLQNIYREKTQKLEEKDRLLMNRETQLKERDKTIQEKNQLLTEKTKELQMKDSILKEKDTMLREIKQVFTGENVRE